MPVTNRRALGAGLFAIAISAGCGSPGAHEDVRYDERFGDSTTMDVYVPNGDGPHSGIMFIHGGAWEGGSKGEYTTAAQRLARSGYVAATINYRLIKNGGTYPHAVQDCLCALSHLRAHAGEYRLDPERVAVMGYSAGGHLSSLVGVGAEGKAHAPDCASGPTAPPRAVITGASKNDLHGTSNLPWVRDFLGGTESEHPDNYDNASPVTYLGPRKPPYLFIAGSADISGNIESSRAMRDSLVAAGNEAQVLEVTGGGHVLNATTDMGHLTIDEADLTPGAWIAITDFLDRTVGQ